METPFARIELEAVRRNAGRAADYCGGHGLSWRPHVKTHKSPRIAKIQLEAGATGLTVATPREAEVMAEVCRDLLLAHPPVDPGKVERAVNLPAEVELRVALDSIEALSSLAAAARRAGREVGVLVEFDAGMHRVGVGDSDELLRLAGAAEEMDGVRFDGILFYPGHIRTHRDAQGTALQALDSLLQRHLSALGKADLVPRIVSGGSTPTLFDSHRIRGLTEVRAGTCIFNDRDMVALGVCGWDDCAYTIRATVVSTAVPGQVVVDAGSKALAKEVFRAEGGGYAVVKGRPGSRVTGLSEEHGIVVPDDPEWSPRVGDMIDLIPNHVCVSVNLQDALQVHGAAGIERWTLPARGRERYEAH